MNKRREGVSQLEGPIHSNMLTFVHCY